MMPQQGAGRGDRQDRVEPVLLPAEMVPQPWAAERCGERLTDRRPRSLAVMVPQPRATDDPAPFSPQQAIMPPPQWRRSRWLRRHGNSQGTFRYRIVPQWCRSRGLGGAVFPVLHCLDVEDPRWCRSRGLRRYWPSSRKLSPACTSRNGAAALGRETRDVGGMTCHPLVALMVPQLWAAAWKRLGVGMIGPIQLP